MLIVEKDFYAMPRVAEVMIENSSVQRSSQSSILRPAGNPGSTEGSAFRMYTLMKLAKID